ncbi:hypothetical protein CBS101457_006856 [Exobasidium rhododendri]|nr:hypothetical protein CBS101457_006856 [Exobasidium rhododendri]
MGLSVWNRKSRPSSTATTVVAGGTPVDSRDEKKEEVTGRGRALSRVAEKDPFLVSFEHIDTQNPKTLPNGKKWLILMLALALQAWANGISAVAAPAIGDISSDLNVSTAAGRVIQAIFLYGFAAGAVVLTPISEDYGRVPTQVISVVLLAIFQIPCALAPNFATIVVFRFLGGFFAATTFNSVGIISDMWEAEDQSWPVNCFALSAELGAVVAPVIGGYTLVRAGWRWIFGICGIGLAFLLALFILFVPETRAGVVLKKRAIQKRKESGDERFYAHHEKALRERTVYAIMQETLFRPVYMLFREPIVLWFALFDGFNYAIIYLALESIPLIYTQWGFGTGAQNLPFFGILIGETIAFCLYYFQLKVEDREARKHKGEKPPESRLLWMIPGAMMFPASLFWFAWTTQGPPIPWIVSVLALGMFGISSHIIFISVSDYTIAAYSIYSASAIGAQSLLREVLSGSVTLFATPLYKNLGYQWASTLLAFLAMALACVPPVLLFFGPRIRAASAFALRIKEAEKEARKDARDAKDEYDRSRSQSRAPSTHPANTTSHTPADLEVQDEAPSP